MQNLACYKNSTTNFLQNKKTKKNLKIINNHHLEPAKTK